MVAAPRVVYSPRGQSREERQERERMWRAHRLGVEADGLFRVLCRGRNLDFDAALAAPILALNAEIWRASCWR